MNEVFVAVYCGRGTWDVERRKLGTPEELGLGHASGPYRSYSDALEYCIRLRKDNPFRHPE